MKKKCVALSSRPDSKIKTKEIGFGKHQFGSNFFFVKWWKGPHLNLVLIVMIFIYFPLSDRTTCANQPCFQGVRCTNVFPNFADIDPRRTSIIKLYQCGPCPPGYTGDGERCEGMWQNEILVLVFSSNVHLSERVCGFKYVLERYTIIGVC